jgi:hypothetical protein
LPAEDIYLPVSIKAFFRFVSGVALVHLLVGLLISTAMRFVFDSREYELSRNPLPIESPQINGRA